MQKIPRWVVALTAMTFVTVAQTRSVEAGFVGMPSMLGTMVKRISFGNYTLPPFAFTQFCRRYADQCKPQQIQFRARPVQLTAERWDDLRQVNRAVNAAIRPEPNTEGLGGEKWLINPSSGDCNDYAVSKRSELLARGWPARALLLSEVATSWGEHHLILVVRTAEGDLVLDNLTPQIQPWAKAPYRWVRMQSPGNPNYWKLPASRTV